MSERETQPPGSADERALAFGLRLQEIANAPRRDLGLLRELAEAWVEIEAKEPRK